jgi:hypothetical protein
MTGTTTGTRTTTARRTLAQASLLLLALGLLAAGAPAQAQTILRDAQAYRSPQRFALELRFGPYSPDVDGEFDGGVTPHRDFFGDDRRLMTQIELDYQLYQGFGSFALGVSAGYFRETARAFAEPPPGEEATVRSGDKSRLALFPFAVLAVYRADQLWRFMRIPLVPYVKAGLNYTLWSVYDGNDRVAEAGTMGRGRGGTMGWQAAAGLSFVMNVIDPGAARELDAETGINHTHLFFEVARFDGSGLGQANKLRVGDTTWLMGLTFEF